MGIKLYLRILTWITRTVNTTALCKSDFACSTTRANTYRFAKRYNMLKHD